MWDGFIQISQLQLSSISQKLKGWRVYKEMILSNHHGYSWLLIPLDDLLLVDVNCHGRVRRCVLGAEPKADSEGDETELQTNEPLMWLITWIQLKRRQTGTRANWKPKVGKLKQLRQQDWRTMKWIWQLWLWMWTWREETQTIRQRLIENTQTRYTQEVIRGSWDTWGSSWPK